MAGKYSDQDYQDALETLRSGGEPDLLDFARRVKADYEAPAPAAAHPDASKVQALFDPLISPVRQALAAQPATTDPRGDEAAAQDWFVSGGASAKGTVFVYEPPLEEVKKRLAGEPDFARLVFGDVPIYPEEIANLTHDSEEYKAAADRMWRDTADEAAKGGVSAYRFARAPWLQDGGAMTAIRSLGMKGLGAAMPALDTINTFVMGLDNTANFGAARAGQETAAALSPEQQGQVPEGAEPLKPGEEADFYMHPTLGKVPKSMGRPEFEMAHTVGEAAGGDVKKANRILEEEHPAAYTAGQVAGAVPGVVGFAGKAVGALGRAAKAGPVGRGLEQGIKALQPWSASNALFEGLGNVGKWGLGKAGVTSGVAPVLTSATAGALGGAGVSAAQDAVTAGANTLQTGSPGMTWSDVGNNALGMAKTTGALGGGGSVIQQVARGGAQAIRNSERFERIPGRIEGDVEFGVWSGPKLSDETKALIQQAQDANIKNPGDIIAKEIAPQIKKAADQEVKAAIKQVTANKERFYATPDAQQRIPVSNFITRGIKLLRESHQPGDAGEMIPVGQRLEKVKNLVNEHIEGVSTKPRPGAVEITPEEAEEFLAKSYQQSLLPKKAGSATSSGSREFDPGDLEGAAGEAGSFATQLRRQGVDKVYLHPQRYDAQRTEHFIQKELKGSRIENKSYRELNELDEALRMDRDVRMLDGKPGGWSALQAQHEELLRAEKSLEKLAAPGGESFNTLVGYGTPKDGELLTAEALRKAAKVAGPETEKKLGELRTFDDLMRLRQMTNWGHYARGAGKSSVYNAAQIRAFPVLRALEPQLGPVGGGMGGRAGLVGQDGDEERIDKALGR